MNKNTLDLIAEMNREISKAMNATIDAAAISAGFGQNEELVNERQEEGKMAKEMLKAYGLEIEDFNDICLGYIAEVNREISKKINATIDAAAISAGFGQNDTEDALNKQAEDYYFRDYVDESWKAHFGKKSDIKEQEFTPEEIDAMMDVYIPSAEDLDYEEMRNPRLRDDERI